jgi:hypothetical protein
MAKTNVTIEREERDGVLYGVVRFKLDDALGSSATGKNINVAKTYTPERVPGTETYVTGLTVYRAPLTQEERDLCALQASSDKGLAALKANADRKAAAKASKATK